MFLIDPCVLSRRDFGFSEMVIGIGLRTWGQVTLILARRACFWTLVSVSDFDIRHCLLCAFAVALSFPNIRGTISSTSEERREMGEMEGWPGREIWTNNVVSRAATAGISSNCVTTGLSMPKNLSMDRRTDMEHSRCYALWVTNGKSIDDFFFEFAKP